MPPRSSPSTVSEGAQTAPSEAAGRVAMTRRDDPHVAALDGGGERGAGGLRHLPAVDRVAGQWLVDEDEDRRCPCGSRNGASRRARCRRAGRRRLRRFASRRDRRRSDHRPRSRRNVSHATSAGPASSPYLPTSWLPGMHARGPGRRRGAGGRTLDRPRHPDPRTRCRRCARRGRVDPGAATRALGGQCVRDTGTGREVGVGELDDPRRVHCGRR